MTAAEARSALRRRAYDAIEVVLVEDGQHRYVGAAELKSVLAAADDAPLASIARRDWPTVEPQTDQEHAVEAARQGGVVAVPVVAADGRPLGLLPPRALIEILSQEHREDVHRLVGILKERAGARHALEDPPLRRASRRLPWLLVGLGMSSIAAVLMAGFEHVLQANIIIAFFIPSLVYLTDAVGTQTEAIAVRGLSLRSRPLRPILIGEIATGSLIGLPLALFAFLGVWLAFGDVLMAVGVAVSLFAASTVASTLGLLLPWMLARLGTDPAFGSGPVATIIQDVITIAIYFVVMTILLAL